MQSSGHGQSKDSDRERGERERERGGKREGGRERDRVGEGDERQMLFIYYNVFPVCCSNFIFSL